MSIKYLSFSGYFILSLILTVTLSYSLAFGFSFFIVPHHSVDPYQLMEAMTMAGERVTSDWWDEVYIPEKHHERFALLGKKREAAFRILFLASLPIILCVCWLVFVRRRWLVYNTISAQRSM